MANSTTQPSVPRYVRPAGWYMSQETRWAAVLSHVLGIEGGHSNDATDRGGETNYGISLRFLKAEGRLDLNGDGFADLDLNFDTVLDGHDIRALTPQIAGEIYLRHFYAGPGLWDLPQPFDAAVFDQAVNGGATAGIKLLQRAINASGDPDIAVDGGLGPKTRAALIARLRQGAPVMDALRTQARLRYEAIVRADPSQRKYIKGWTRRALELGRV